MTNENYNHSEQKPLAQKSDAELKREAEARLHHMSPEAKHDFLDNVVVNPVTDSVTGFVDFLREKAVVGLAVGFVIGTQVQIVVNQFVNSIINPMLGLILPGEGKLDGRSWYVVIGNHSTTFYWGKVVYALLDFIFVLFVIYAVIKLLKLDKLDKKNPAPKNN